MLSPPPTTFAFIPGAGDVGWCWHLVEADLRARGHDTIAPDPPCDDGSAGLPEYADTVVEAIAERTNVVVVAQSLGGFTAPRRWSPKRRTGRAPSRPHELADRLEAYATELGLLGDTAP